MSSCFVCATAVVLLCVCDSCGLALCVRQLWSCFVCCIDLAPVCVLLVSDGGYCGAPRSVSNFYILVVR